MIDEIKNNEITLIINTYVMNYEVGVAKKQGGYIFKASDYTVNHKDPELWWLKEQFRRLFRENGVEIIFYYKTTLKNDRN